MSDITTIARPYAKAIFEQAVATKSLKEWSIVLENLATAILLPETIDFLTNPTVTKEQQQELLLSVIGKVPKSLDKSFVENLISLLATNKRLLVQPEIALQYDALRREHEKTITVHVTSFSPLSDIHQSRLIELLSKKLKREVSLSLQIDETLLGGAIIKAGNLVIDGSVHGQLRKMASSLAA